MYAARSFFDFFSIQLLTEHTLVINDGACFCRHK